jgi:hypothetical protein
LHFNTIPRPTAEKGVKHIILTLWHGILRKLQKVV